MVTRTIQTTRCNVMRIKIIEGEPFNKEIILPRTYKDEKHLMKQVESVINTDEVKAVHVVSTEIEYSLFGMDEQKFIENAEILPPRTKEEKE